jgi:hypothetical protein
MTLRERIADWISGGRLSEYRKDALDWASEGRMRGLGLRSAQAEAANLRAEAANIAAQRDEAEKRANLAESKVALVEAAFAREQRDSGWWSNLAEVSIGKLQKAEAAQTALRAILTARNITEARKIAKQALGDGE